MLFSSCSSVSCCNKRCIDWSLLLLRLAAGSVFVYTGYSKLFTDNPGISGFTQMLTGLGFPAPSFFAYLVGIIEFVGGIALIAGAGVAFFAPLLAVIMLVAFFTAKKAAFPAGMIDVAMFGITAALSLSGGGGFALGKGKGESAEEQGCKCGSECACGGGDECQCASDDEEGKKEDQP